MPGYSYYPLKPARMRSFSLKAGATPAVSLCAPTVVNGYCITALQATVHLIQK